MEALKMETPMDSWNDERLDELSRRMDEGFKEMREGFARMDQRFERMDQRFNQRFEAVDQKFERLLHILVLIAWSFAGTLVAALAAVLVAALS
jgi:hypothetical protein